MQRLEEARERKNKNERIPRAGLIVWKREIERGRWVRVIEGQMDN